MAISVVEFVQEESFIPKSMPKGTVQQGMSLRDALRLARGLGCKIVETNSRDYAVWHQVCGQEYRPAVVSIANKDATRILIQYLRKVYDRVQRQVDQNKSMERQKEVNSQVELVGGLDAAPESVLTPPRPENGAATPPPARLKDAPPPPARDARRAVAFFEELLKAIHYREHTTVGQFHPYSECEHDLCVLGRRQCEIIMQLAADIVVAEKLLAEAAVVPPKPAAEPTPEQPRRPVGDLGRFFDTLDGCWHSSTPQGFSRMCQALTFANKVDPDAIQDCVNGRMDWETVKDLVCNAVGEGMERSWVGPVAFDRAYQYLTKASKLYHV